ncbi:FliG C-terminal domain-containing protein [Thiomicrospira microaerophila]|uniref:FliG C-terminal domain-containing protein n=1 Tax=Thiomicrospira microaerophila TaxID=406020 RepID=UPI0005CB3FF6|nr:FliG C-terminal domain-containing protein [Thiomicrospira microaerophila]
MDVKVKCKDAHTFLIEAGYVIITLPDQAAVSLVEMMDYRLKQLTPEDAAALQKSLEAHRRLVLKMVEIDNPTIQQVLTELNPMQKVILCNIDKSGRIKKKVMENLPKIKRKELEEDLAHYKKITVKKALNQMDHFIVPILKKAILQRKKIRAEDGI